MNQEHLRALSPYEYLDYLQKEEFGGRAPYFAADIGDVLTASLISSLPDNQREHLEEMGIVIGVLPSTDINAWTVKVPSGEGAVIVFSFALMSFLLALNKVLLSRVIGFGLETTMDPGSAAQHALSILNARPGGEMPRMQLSPRRLLMASALSNVQAAFVVGHELSHHILGHFQGTNLEERRPSKLQAMEFEADRRGAELAFASYMRNSDALFGAGDTTLAQAGPDIFLTYLIFMFDIYNVQETGYSSHPTPELRRAKLREHYWEDMPEQARALAQQAESIFGAFAAILEPKEEGVTTEHSMDRAASSRPRRPRKK